MKPLTLHSRRRRPSRKSTRYARLLVVVIAFATALAATATARGAVVYRAGKPGPAQLPVTQGWSADTGHAVVSFPPRCVWRSPATRFLQRVTIVLRVTTYDRIYRTWDLKHRAVARGATYPRHPFCISRYSPSFVGLLGDLYRTEIIVRWFRYTSGRWLGRARYVYVHTYDYQCLSHSCSVSYSRDARSAGLFISSYISRPHTL